MDFLRRNAAYLKEREKAVRVPGSLLDLCLAQDNPDSWLFSVIPCYIYIFNMAQDLLMLMTEIQIITIKAASITTILGNLLSFKISKQPSVKLSYDYNHVVFLATLLEAVCSCHFLSLLF